MSVIGITLSGLAVAVLAYLLGSLSFAIIITKLLYHKDIRTFGSGNAGMTNVLRTFGKGAAALTLIGDIGKGTLAVVLGKLIFAQLGLPAIWGACIAWVCAVLGHVYPVYFHFKGGKAISVGAGTIIGVHPLLIVPVLGTFLIVFLISRMVSLASICAAVMYPLATFLCFQFVFHQSPLLPTLTAIVVASIALLKHRSNMKRIRNGTEYKFVHKDTPAAP